MGDRISRSEQIVRAVFDDVSEMRKIRMSRPCLIDAMLNINADDMSIDVPEWLSVKYGKMPACKAIMIGLTRDDKTFIGDFIDRETNDHFEAVVEIV